MLVSADQNTVTSGSDGGRHSVSRTATVASSGNEYQMDPTGVGHRRGMGDDLGRDGQATFEYGPEPRPGEPHVTWQRVGTHATHHQPPSCMINLS